MIYFVSTESVAPDPDCPEPVNLAKYIGITVVASVAVVAIVAGIILAVAFCYTSKKTKCSKCYTSSKNQYEVKNSISGEKKSFEMTEKM